jgi:hypothetical protein
MAALVGGLASSAALGLDTGFGGAAGAGDGPSLTTCHRQGVRAALRTGFDPALGYVVTAVAVDVDGIGTGCAGHRLSVALTDATGTVAVQAGPLAMPASGGTFTVPVPPVAVETVAKVHTLLE